MDLRDRISDYKDFPKKGILFRDFSPILKDPAALSYVVDEFSKKFHLNDIDVFAGIEARGFIIACLVAQKYNVRSIPNVLIISNGEVKEQVVGNVPEADISALLDKLV